MTKVMSSWISAPLRGGLMNGTKGGEGSVIGLFVTYLLRVRGEQSVSYEFRTELNVYSQPGGEKREITVDGAVYG